MFRVSSAVARRSAAAWRPVTAAAWRPTVAVRTMADEAAPVSAAADDEIVLNFAAASAPIVDKVPAKRVTVPGRAGTLGLEARSPPLVSELRPGVVTVEYAKEETARYIVPGGFLFAHANNKVDVSTPEAVKPEDIDVDMLRVKAEEARQAYDTAPKGTKESAEAMIQLEVYKAIGAELDIKF